MSNCHRLPGFAHFESSLSNPMCSFEQLDIRFATEDVGLPPPYPGSNTGLDLSSVNGLDLTSPNYEGLNLSQQCLNLSNSNSSRSNTSQPTQLPTQDQATKQNQQYSTQSGMVLNLSTQIGLNLTRPAPADMTGYSMLGQDLNQINGNNNNFQSNHNNSNFDYYGTYYDNYPNTATSTLCQMEEQRCSPLNLERRSSPLNLTSVGNIQRKRKPTPGQVTPIHTGKLNSMMAQESYTMQQSSGQDFTCNNQVYDYRIPNKLTAFYNQQQQAQITPAPIQSQPHQNPAQLMQNTNSNPIIQPQSYPHKPSNLTSGTVVAQAVEVTNKSQFPVIDPRYNNMKQDNQQQIYNKQKQVSVTNGNSHNLFQSNTFTKHDNMQISQSATQPNSELYFPDLTFQQNNPTQHETIHQALNQTISYPNLSNSQRKLTNPSQGMAPSFTSSCKVISQPPSASKPAAHCHHTLKQIPNIQNIVSASQISNQQQISQQGKQILNTTNQMITYDEHQSEDILFPDTYSDLNYSYSDALNFAAEAMNASPTNKVFAATACHSQEENKQAKTKPALQSDEKQGVVNDLSTSNKIRLFCSSCEVEFANSTDMNLHMDSHNKTSHLAKFICSLCKINFPEESQLLSHNKLNHDTNRVKSSPTKKTYPKISSFEDKQPMNMTISQMKEMDNKEKSRESMKYIKNKSEIEIMKLKEESAKEPFPYQCVTCAKKFQERNELIQHLEEHNDLKPFKCDLCNLGFTHLSAKKRHEKAHTNDKPHQCKDCPKAFFRKSDLTQHTKTHSKDKLQHACAACAQMFKTEKKLKHHTCSALQPLSKQLKCEMCPSVLTTKVSWGVHMWKHTKDSSYILTSESDPWPASLGNKRPTDLGDLNPWKRDLDNLQPLNMQAVPS
eukprot:GFUD01031673.1.p1 GENE.GFUD01031673.1~~GFUD01031673.1.p1  ORF type:complete len:892 (-),score=187.50 GFUD01031673.1:7-2682(-)